MLIHVFMYMYTYMWVSFPSWILRVRTGPKAAKCTAPRPSSPLRFTGDPAAPKTNLVYPRINHQKREILALDHIPWNQVVKFQVKNVSTKTPSLPTLLPPPSWHSPHSPHPLWWHNSMAPLAVPWSETLLRPKSFWTSWFLGSLSKTSLVGWSHRWKKGDKVLFIPNECP